MALFDFVKFKRKVSLIKFSLDVVNQILSICRISITERLLGKLQV